MMVLMTTYTGDMLYAAPSSTIIFAPQFVKSSLTKEESSQPFFLQEEKVKLGDSSPDVQNLLLNVAPLLKGCRLEKSRSLTSSDKKNIHEYYEVYCRESLLYGAFLMLHWRHGTLVMIQGDFPTQRIEEHVFSDLEYTMAPNDFLTAYLLKGRDLEDRDEIFDVNKIIFFDGKLFKPAWLIDWFNGHRGIKQRVIVDPLDGAWLQVEDIGFSAAKVYEHGPQDQAVISVDLDDLDESGYLDGSYFSVFAPTEYEPRVYGPDGDFEYSPTNENDVMNFNEVQAYYGASRALKWFQKKFSFEMDESLIIRLYPSNSYSVNESGYSPPGFGGPMIEIGIGDGQKYANLARDTDVMTHEFSHHVLFRHLKYSTGQTGVLHEGFADYFAYAINGDPYLGETIKPGASYLRTALQSKDLRFDDPRISQEAHVLGEVWSALLWDMREQIGSDMDYIAYHALPYMSARAGYQEAIIGLLNADRDLYPLVSSDADYQAFGIHKCEIIEAAVARGLATYIENVDGVSCKLELASLANESRAYTEAHTEKKKKGKTINLNLGGKPCAVIGMNQIKSGAEVMRSALFLTPFLIMLPIFLFGFRRSVKGLENKGIKKGGKVCN